MTSTEPFGAHARTGHSIRLRHSVVRENMSASDKLHFAPSSLRATLKATAPFVITSLVVPRRKQAVIGLEYKTKGRPPKRALKGRRLITLACRRRVFQLMQPTDLNGVGGQALKEKTP